MSISGISTQDYEIAPVQQTSTAQTGIQASLVVNGQDFSALLNQMLSQIMHTCPHCGETSPLAESSDVSATDSPYEDTLNNLVRKPMGSTQLSPYGNSLMGPNGLMNIKWEGRQNLSSWPETAQIDVTSMSDGKIRWRESGDRPSWGVEDGVDSNAWLIREVAPGQYEGRTWEWVRPGQTVKNLENIYEMWEPKPGERVGIMIAGMTRNGHTPNAMQRSNIDWVTWPG